MGSGIAQVAATAGCSVKLYDLKTEALEHAQNSLEKIMDRLVEKGKMDQQEKERIENNIEYVDTLKKLTDSDWAIEAIVENLEIKKNVLSTLEKFVSEDCIIATNTSSLSVASIAASLEKPERCIGIHFFNPAPLMKLVEIIPAIQTSEETLNASVEVIKSWRKTVAVAKDTPGFIVNRVARPFYGEALRIYEEGIASFAEIDAAIKEIGGFRMGPFELMDFIGNDVNYTVTETVFEAFYYDPRYKPSFTQKRFAEAGYLGRKSGKGYYNYSENGKMSVQAPAWTVGRQSRTQSGEKADPKLIFDRILTMLINEAADAVFWNVASEEDIDNAMIKGVNYPKGLLAWANEKGIDWCVEQMDKLYDTYHEDRYRCSSLLRKMSLERTEFHA